ncbi:MAG: amylo-alpha,6-glucosidase [Acidobacteriaceae bacterium]|nr:amylo-alpha,6-glucosidase [Acidobacteriaceae bacterium]
MDEANVTQQYYIATKSSPADDRTRVLKYGKMFSVFDRLGDIQIGGLGEQGIFSEGTRHLSHQAIYLWNSSPLFLSSTIESNNFLFTADLANLDVSRGDQVVIPRGTLHILRSKFLWEHIAYEEFRFDNYGMSDLLVPFRMFIDADFADIFEVRGMHRTKRGQRLENQIDHDSILMSYIGLDNVTRLTRMRCEPAPASIGPSEFGFYISLRPQQSATLRFTLSCDYEAETSLIGYSPAMAAASEELKEARLRVPEIYSSNSRLNDWIRRSFADVEMMIVGNPEENYPYAGVPWFSTVFGRDGIITALEMLWLNPEIAKGVLEYLAETQATEFDPEIEAEPGKILHEMRKGEMAALGEVPFGRYYGTVDATPLFIMLAGAYYKHTGNRDLLEKLWPHIELALNWIDKYGDLDGDGFVEYSRRGKSGLVQQGWKDSNDSVFHADGSLAEPPIALCEVQGYVYAAKRAAAELASARGDIDRCKCLEAQAEKLQKNFENAFWCPELSTYALALDAQKRPCKVRTSNAGHCLFAGIATPEKGRLVAEQLLTLDFFTGWGVRTVACCESRYNPLSYHNGSIWPHDNALIASGLAKYDCKHLAGQILLALLDVSNKVELRRLPELFCGLERRRGEGPTLYPVACSPQAWASGAAFLVLQACLGISIDEECRQIVFDRPYLPDGVPQLWIKNLRAGANSVDLQLDRQRDTVGVQVLDKRGDLKVFVNL